MTQIKLSVFIILSASILISALPLESDKEKDVVKVQPIILEAVELVTEQATVTEMKPNTDSVATVADEKPTTLEESPQTTSSESSTSSESALTSASTSNPPKPTVSTLIDLLPSLELTPPPKRVVQYDQRQDGKYNIRADLENFVVLVVPSSGFSLLDLLRRSNTHHHKRAHGKHHKKYHSSHWKSDESTHKEANRLDYLRPEPSDLVDTHPIAVPAPAQFIEGRTPYHVDISSSEINHPSLSSSITKSLPNVLRSLLIKPLSIADLPLSDDPSVVNDDDTIAALLPAHVKGNNKYDGFGKHHKKSLTNDNDKLSLNTVLLTPIQLNNNNNKKHAIVDNVVNNSGDGDIIIDLMQQTNESDKKHSEFIDIIDTKNSFDSLNVDNIDRLASSDTKSSSDSQWELTLLGAQEQCGPDRRRDSYGICQFVPHDYIHRF